MGSIEKFIDAMRWAADSDNVGYDQGDRTTVQFYSSKPTESDCSWLVVAALQHAGFETGGASYTGNMAEELCKHGWKRVANDGNPQAGDILLNHVNHVAVWLGDCLAQASIDENGDIRGGRAGDQTGDEVNTRGYYNYPWDCYLRWTGAGASGSSSKKPASKPKAKDRSCRGDVAFRVSTDSNGGKWLGKCEQGTPGEPIRFIAIEGMGKYRAATEASGWLPWVSGYDVDDLDKGCAGDGSPITAIECKSKKLRYAVRVLDGEWYDDMIGSKDTGGSSDHFAGDLANEIDGFYCQKV